MKKMLGMLFLCLGAVGLATSVIVFLILSFNPSSPLLNRFMVDFRLIDVTGVAGYYSLLLSALLIISIPIVFVAILGFVLSSAKKNYCNRKTFSRLIFLFIVWLVVFLSLSNFTERRFEEKKASMKETPIEKYFDINDFNSIHVSRFVKFDDITIRQGEGFSVAAKGSQFDQIGLNFEKTGDTLSIKRSEMETYYNTETWVMENDKAPFSAGTKALSIEITMPDIEKVESEGGHIELVDFNVDNIEIRLNKRFNNVKGNITVEDTLKLNAAGGIINLVGSAKNLIVNSGDCWVEMDRFMAKQAIINARDTSRLNVNVSENMVVQSDENSVVTNHYEEK